MYKISDFWMSEWGMGGWVDGWMDGWMDGSMNEVNHMHPLSTQKAQEFLYCNSYTVGITISIWFIQKGHHINKSG